MRAPPWVINPKQTKPCRATDYSDKWPNERYKKEVTRMKMVMLIHFFEDAISFRLP